MNHVIAVLVRLTLMAIALTAYTLLVVPRMTAPGDADIGAGLIAFGALMLVGFVGGLVDTLRQGAVTAVVWWLAIAIGLAVGWWIALAVPQDTSSSFGELLAMDAGLLPFTVGLVAGPAVVGAVVGNAIPRGTRR